MIYTRMYFFFSDIKKKYLARLISHWCFTLEFSGNSNYMEKFQKHISDLKLKFCFPKSFQPLRSLTFAVFQQNLEQQEIRHLLIKALGSCTPAFTDLSHRGTVKAEHKVLSYTTLLQRQTSIHRNYPRYYPVPRSAHPEMEWRGLNNTLVTKGTARFDEWEPPTNFNSLQRKPAPMAPAIQALMAGQVVCWSVSCSLFFPSHLTHLFCSFIESHNPHCWVLCVCVVSVTFCAI